MGSRKNYKASVEVGWSVPLEFFLCVICVYFILSTNHVDWALVPSLVTVAPVWLSVIGVFVVSHNKTMLLKSSHDSSGPMARSVSHKTGSRIIVHGSTVGKWEPPGSFDWQGVSFSCSCVSQKGRLLSRENHLFEAESCRLDPCLKSSHWNSPVFFCNTYSQETSNTVPVHLAEHNHPYEWCFLSPDLLSSFRLLFLDPSPCSGHSSCRVGLCWRSRCHLSSPWFSGVGVDTRRMTFLITFLLMRLPSRSM